MTRHALKSLVGTVLLAVFAAAPVFAQGGKAAVTMPPAAGGSLKILGLAVLAFLVLIALIRWRVYSKAGKPGIASLIPIWAEIAFCQIGGKPAWWFLLYCVPVVNVIIHFVVCIGVAKKFGKGAGFGVGLVLLPIIFFPILAFGAAEYEGGMELPEDGETQAAGMPRRAVAKGPTGPIIRTDGVSVAVAAWVAIIALILLLAVIIMQLIEVQYYASDLPQNGTGSAWPAKPGTVSASITPMAAGQPEAKPAKEEKPAAPETKPAEPATPAGTNTPPAATPAPSTNAPAEPAKEPAPAAGTTNAPAAPAAPAAGGTGQ